MTTTDPLTTISTRRTPQSEKADARQVQNSASGYTFELDDEGRLRRFLTLGTDGSTYYTSAADLTRENAAVVFRMAAENHRLAVDTVVQISEAGRAPKQNPALFSLAILASHGSDSGRSYALSQLHRVARTGTHLFIFARYVEQFRGWGRGLRRAVSDWYLAPEVDKVAFQAVKYRQREGWSHRDLLRLSSPGKWNSAHLNGAAADPARKSTFEWIVRGTTDENTPRIIEGYLKAQEPGANYAALITEYGLSWEMLPDNALTERATWEALLNKGMPQTALMRQLPRLTNLGLFKNGSYRRLVADQLQDSEGLRRGRVHPVNVLVAARTYASGQAARGENSWKPDGRIIDALDSAFYAAFGAIEPNGKRHMLNLDVSGSMTSSISNMPLTCREASAALALVTAATEDDWSIYGFTSGGRGFSRFDSAITPLSITPRQRLDDAITTVSGLPFGGTDCALPMIHALKEGLKVDVFHVYTDNETWGGNIHPHQALQQYRRETGIPAKLVVVGMTATPFSIADPSDSGSMDVAGFDSAVPQLISDFARGF